ncbi:hypothetical protein SEA_ROSIEPOSIE_104 [Arthrobacter phage RosiePosie]|uniref:Uncharacterized protein n=10 Tax=Klausavirus princesstrina TaxID=1984784 RepID=A0A1J0GRZ5_9CAUD|nr:hypothetical protein FDI82_gp104 [Arthrobacter phage PrincessTrina]AOZ64654.1 hypothetical protein SEA_CHUBSTER_103 [Arthrobacter phage Chubster]AOZ64767.1 hypothetical protein SEA_CHOCOLAT_104 [Arthrobacter phage Chocolat]APC44896.1 hypothetical protein SEA_HUMPTYDUMPTY_103 [Arthrobacter phage HumptyDumpty]ASX98887.1 hypothetical protein SEA_KABREEZE_103 [Arthrobacter phage Kabreeze]ASX98999.1 hypothetical protein SEA_ROSIEPOSIE_104 [Arthrobacter phage RosiePosie]ASX99111.1 hypothetical p
MDAFEYQTVKVPRDAKGRTKALTAYGQQGWEVTHTSDAWQKTVTVTMRRMVPGGARPKPKQPGLLGLIFQAIANRNTAK